MKYVDLNSSNEFGLVGRVTFGGEDILLRGETYTEYCSHIGQPRVGNSERDRETVDSLQRILGRIIYSRRTQREN